MPESIELPASPSPALLDGAIAFALATGVPLRLVGPMRAADALLLLAAVKLCAPDSLTAQDAARAELATAGPFELPLGRPRAGSYSLQLDAPGAVARAANALSWPLALTGRPSTLRFYGPNHGEGAPTFHELRLCWAPLAQRFGLKM